MDAEIDFFDWLEAEVNESDEPPHDTPSDEELACEWPLVKLHVPHLHPPNFECGGASRVPNEVLKHECSHRNRLQIQDYAVAVKGTREGLFGNDRVELPEVKSEAALGVAFVSAVQVVVTNYAEHDDCQKPSFRFLGFLQHLVQKWC